MREDTLTPREAAAVVMAILQRRGATFTINADGNLRCNLDGANLSGHAEADDLVRIVLALATEIKQLLDEDRIVHFDEHPAMKAVIADDVWEIEEEIVKLLD